MMPKKYKISIVSTVYSLFETPLAQNRTAIKGKKILNKEKGASPKRYPLKTYMQELID